MTAHRDPADRDPAHRDPADRDPADRFQGDLERLRARTDRNRAWSKRLDASSRDLAQALAATEDYTAAVLSALPDLEPTRHRRQQLAAQARRAAVDLRSWAGRSAT